MLIVADSSPINFLIRIGAVEALPALFQRIVVPPEVEAELRHERTPQIVRDFMSNRPACLEVRAAARNLPIAEVDAGERAAISLVIELAADLLLIDDWDGRRAATERKVADHRDRRSP